MEVDASHSAPLLSIPDQLILLSPSEFKTVTNVANRNHLNQDYNNGFSRVVR